MIPLRYIGVGVGLFSVLSSTSLSVMPVMPASPMDVLCRYLVVDVQVARLCVSVAPASGVGFRLTDVAACSITDGART